MKVKDKIANKFVELITMERSKKTFVFDYAKRTSCEGSSWR